MKPIPLPQERGILTGKTARSPWAFVPLPRYGALHLTNLFPHMSLQTEMDRDARLLTDLLNNVYQLAVTHVEPEGEPYFWKECMRETLMFALPKGHRYAKRKSLSFSEMNGENMLLMPDIGFWDFVTKDRMPDSRFLTQSDRFSFNELMQASSLPAFTSDLAEKYAQIPSGRVNIPISDEDSSVSYYLVCLTDRKKAFASLFSAL